METLSFLNVVKRVVFARPGEWGITYGKLVMLGIGSIALKRSV
jgi:hypothetical protein